MLFPYTYVPHQMERMQEFIDFIFYEVWCKAPIGLTFHPDLFDNNPDLKELMSEFGFSAQAAEPGKAFYKKAKAIYELFAPLSPAEVEQFKQWYQGNNSLEKACANDPAVQLARYEDIALAHHNLANQLRKFFIELYSQDLLKCSALRAKIGKINDHYKAFVAINNAGKCPFCGMTDLLSEDNSKRDPYDHYLPKVHYPFNSINFKNLVPACHHCNSSYKGQKDPLHNGTHRRKAFYPYELTRYAIKVQITIKHLNVATLTKEDIDLQFGPAELSEEISTWRDVYCIDERYKAKLCKNNDGRYWLTQFLDEWKTAGHVPTDYLKKLTEQTTDYPYAECNFLKEPFLDACKDFGIQV